MTSLPNRDRIDNIMFNLIFISGDWQLSMERLFNLIAVVVYNAGRSYLLTIFRSAVQSGSESCRLVWPRYQEREENGEILLALRFDLLSHRCTDKCSASDVLLTDEEDIFS